MFFGETCRRYMLGNEVSGLLVFAFYLFTANQIHHYGSIGVNSFIILIFGD